MAAIQTAALIPEAVRQLSRLCDIVLIADGSWTAPDPDTVFLGGGHASGNSTLVHSQLETDTETLIALKKLGIKPSSPETIFRGVASDLLATSQFARRSSDWPTFWELARDIERTVAGTIIQSYTGWRSSIRVLTMAGEWRSLFNTLLPGPIVPADGSRDGNVAIDLRFHELDLPLLRHLGAVDSPRSGHELSPAHLRRFTAYCRDMFAQRDLPRDPQRHRLNFRKPATTTGPLDVLEKLADESKVTYTWHMLDLASMYEQWTMSHDTQDIYPPMDFESPAIEVLRQHGRVETRDGTFPLSDGLGNPPQNRAVLYKMLSHLQADQIRRVFNLHEMDVPVEPIGEDVAVPLLDVWPGLEPHLLTQQKDLQLVRCDGFRRFDGSSNKEEPDCIIRDNFVYVARQEDEEQEFAPCSGNSTFLSAMSRLNGFSAA